MEKTYKRVPFDIELAKKIQSGEVEGKIVTRDGYSARIICDNVNSSYPLICAISFEPNDEEVFCYRLDGSYHYECCEHDLFIELPEETPKTQADLCEESWLEDKKRKPYIQQLNKLKDYTQELMDVNQKVIDDLDSMVEDLKRICKLEETPKHEFKVGDYVQYGEGKFFKEKLEIVKIDNSIPNNVWIECSTEDGLINIKCPILEVKPYEEKHEFKPFDKVLVRNLDSDVWIPIIYEGKFAKSYWCSDGYEYDQCIPYEGHEELVGTTDNPE